MLITIQVRHVQLEDNWARPYIRVFINYLNDYHRQLLGEMDFLILQLFMLRNRRFSYWYSNCLRCASLVYPNLGPGEVLDRPEQDERPCVFCCEWRTQRIYRYTEDIYC